MELRKCECGCIPRIVFLGSFTVECFECEKQTTGIHEIREQAIQAWNEGKVE